MTGEANVMRIEMTMRSAAKTKVCAASPAAPELTKATAAQDNP